MKKLKRWKITTFWHLDYFSSSIRRDCSGRQRKSHHSVEHLLKHHPFIASEFSCEIPLIFWTQHYFQFCYLLKELCVKLCLWCIKISLLVLEAKSNFLSLHAADIFKISLSSSLFFILSWQFLLHDLDTLYVTLRLYHFRVNVKCISCPQSWLVILCDGRKDAIDAVLQQQYFTTVPVVPLIYENTRKGAQIDDCNQADYFEQVWPKEWWSTQQRICRQWPPTALVEDLT